MKCPKCGIPMLQLQGWDFLHEVCFNPVHDVPVHYTETWGCGDGTVTDRPLTECEQQIIDERKKDLVEGLSVVKTNWELVGLIHCFWSGGYNPEIRKRLEDLKNPKKYPCPKCGSQMTYNKLTAYDFIGDYRGFCCEKCNHEFIP